MDLTASRRLPSALVIGIVAFATVVLGGLILWSCSREGDRATGEVVSIEPDPETDVLVIVCVAPPGGEAVCGRQAPDDERMDGIVVGGCARIRVVRSAAVELDSRPCPS